MKIRKQILTLAAGASLVALGYSCQKSDVVETSGQSNKTTSVSNVVTPETGGVVIDVNFDIKGLEEATPESELRALGWYGGKIPTIDKTNFKRDLTATNPTTDFQRNAGTYKLYLRSKTVNADYATNGVPSTENQTDYMMESFVSEVGALAGNNGRVNFVENSDGTGYRVTMGAGAKTFFPTSGDIYGIMLTNGANGATQNSGYAGGTQSAALYEGLYFYSEHKNSFLPGIYPPNKAVKEVLDGTVDNRTYPYISDFQKVTILNHRNPETKVDMYGNSYPGYTYGEIKVTLKPRGVLFRIQLANKTGNTITVDSILGDNTADRMLAYEGFYNLGAKNFSATSGNGSGERAEAEFTFNGAVSNDDLAVGVVPTFQEFYSYNYLNIIERDNQYSYIHNRFPVYQSDGTTAGYPMTAGQVSDGYFYVWGYPIREATDALDGARFRIKYTQDGTSKKSAVIKVSPMTKNSSTGKYAFEDGKVYTVRFSIKESTTTTASGN